jgi:hypothetical protein
MEILVVYHQQFSLRESYQGGFIPDLPRLKCGALHNPRTADLSIIHQQPIRIQTQRFRVSYHCWVPAILENRGTLGMLFGCVT